MASLLSLAGLTADCGTANIVPELSTSSEIQGSPLVLVGTTVDGVELTASIPLSLMEIDGKQVLTTEDTYAGHYFPEDCTPPLVPATGATCTASHSTGSLTSAAVDADVTPPSI